MEYNGYSSWNAWNVSLWISNDENTYNYALDLINQHGIRKAVRLFIESSPKTTPDGAKYNNKSVWNAFKELKE